MTGTKRLLLILKWALFLVIVGLLVLFLTIVVTGVIADSKLANSFNLFKSYPPAVRTGDVVAGDLHMIRRKCVT